jgi:hypothetical protein
MSQAGASVTPTDVRNPLPGDRSLDQRVDPHCSTDRGALKCNSLDVIARNHRNLAAGKHLDAVIGDSQKGILKVDQIALHVNCANLPMTRPNDFVADRETPKHDARMGGLLPFSYNVVVCLYRFNLVRQPKHGFAVRVFERHPILELPQHRFEG